MKFTLKKGSNFDRGDIKGTAFNTKEQFSRMSAAIFSVKGKHPKMKSLNSDRLYFVIQGRGLFNINNQQVQVNKNDVIIIPRNIPYSYQGVMKCFLVHAPAFDREKEVKLEK